MRRTLALKKEALAELTTAELGGVAGAQGTPGCPVPPTFEYCVSFSRCVIDAVSDAVNPCPWEPTVVC